MQFASTLINQKREVPSDPRNFPALWTPKQTHVWKKGYFDVPIETSQDRVDFAAAGYRNRLGDALEREGFEVLALDGPHLDTSVVAVGTTDPDRKRYVIWAKVRRRPITFHVDVPDEDVSIYEKSGFRLTE